MTIRQDTSRAAINWQSFSVGSAASVTINQPNSAAVILNRVVGQDPSQIFGSLSANGQVFIVNPSGVLFGRGAQVNAQGILASTRDITVSNFMNGVYRFEGADSGTVMNEGSLNGSRGGYVALIGAQVKNLGDIQAPLGDVRLSAADKVLITVDNGSLASFAVERGTLNGLVENGGAIRADGGRVWLTADALDTLSKAVVNNTGVIEARTAESRGGTIFLLADKAVGQANVSGRLDASAPNGGDGGFIETSAAKVHVDDAARITALAPSGKAGTWLIDPVDFTVSPSGADMTGAALSAQLAGANVTIQSSGGAQGANGDVNIMDAVSWNAATTLKLNAWRDVHINRSITASNAGGKLALEYGQGNGTVSGNGGYYIYAPVNLQNGPNFSIKYYTYPTTTFNVINSIGAIQGMSMSGNYALGANVNASGYAFNPLGTFTGIFEGLGHTVDRLTINKQWNVVQSLSGPDYMVGLFSNNRGTIRDLGLTNASVAGANIAFHSWTFVTGGALVAHNYGTILDCFATGSVSAYAAGIAVGGGLVGSQDGGIISNSYFIGSVAGGYSKGGLAGYHSGGSISNSYSVTSNAQLVGMNSSGAGAVTNSFWVGSGYPNYGGSQISAAQLQDPFNFIAAGWGFGTVWGKSQTGYNNGYPVLFGGSGSGNAYDYYLRVQGNTSRLYGDPNPSLASAVMSAGIGISGASAGWGTAITSTTNVGTYSYAAPNVLSVSYNLTTGDSSNYSFYVTPNSGSLTIGARPVTLTGSRVYDGTTAAAASIFTVGNLANGETLTLTGSGTTSSKNAGTYSAFALGTLALANGTGLASNYTLTGTRTATIAPRPVNLSGSRIYDGTTNMAAGSFALGNLVGAETLTLTGTGTVADKNVGVGKAVSKGTLALSNGTGLASNYTLVGGTMLGDITSRVLNIAWAGANKVYDGTTNATVTETDNRIATDVLSLNYTAAFADKNAGTGKTVSIGGISLSGADAGNYTLSASSTSTTANITPKTLTLSGGSDTKTYDGTTLMSSGYSLALAGGGTTAGDGKTITGDNVTLTGTAVYGSANAGTQTINRGTVALSGTDAGNYTLSWTNGSGTIGQAALVITANDAAKLVTQADPNFAATSGVSYSGFVHGDTAAVLGGTLAIMRSNTGMQSAGTYAGVLTPSGLTSSGNYAITFKNGDFTIVPAQKLLVTANNASVVYGSAASYGIASVQYIDTGNVIHTLTQTSASGNTYSYSDGVGGTITFTLAAAGPTSTGGALNVGNYRIGDTTPTIGGSNFTSLLFMGNLAVTQKGISATNLAPTKNYDGTTSISGASLGLGVSGTVAGDALTVSGSGAYDSKNVGTGLGYTVSGLGISGADAGNYYLTGTTYTGTNGVINPRPLNATYRGANKVYDGTTTTTVTTVDDRIAGDTLTVSATGAFLDPNASTGKTVAVSGASLSGTDAANYALASTTGSTIADITPRIVDLSGSRTYDGTTDVAAGIFTIGNRVGTETLTLSGSGTVADKNAGNGKAVTLGTLALGDGTGLASNYTLVGGTDTADITPRTLTMTYNKVYDGGLTAAVTGDNRVAGDVLGFSGSAAFTDPNAGTGKTVNFTGMSLTGADAGNYVLAAGTGSTTSNIAPRPVDLSGSRIYDGTTNVAAGIFTLGNLAGTETLTLTGTGTVADKNVGTGKAVTLGTLALGSGSGLASNYTLVGGTDTADITPRTLTVSYNKVYDGSLAATVTGDNRIAGDVLGFGGSATFGDKNAGTGKTVNVASLTLSGADAGNYALAFTSGTTTADITPKTLTLSGGTSNKTYDGTASMSSGYSLALASGGTAAGDGKTIAGDTVGLSGAAAYASANAGTQAITQGTLALSGVDAGNYTLSWSNGSGTIGQAALVITANDAAKLVTQTDPNFAATSGVSYSGFVRGETAAVLGGTLAITRSNVGTEGAGTYAGVLVPSGLTSPSGNYAITFKNGDFTIVPAQKLLVTANNASVVYGSAASYGIASVQYIDTGNVIHTLNQTSASGNTYSYSDTAGGTITFTLAATGPTSTGGALNVGNYRIDGTNTTIGGSNFTSLLFMGNLAVTQKGVSATSLGPTKTYDGTTSISGTSLGLGLDSMIAGDALTVSGTGVLASKNAGSGLGYTVSGIGLSGPDAGNYYLITDSLTGTNGTITPRTLNPSYSAATKAYDGTTSATVTALDDRIAGDVLTVSASGAFLDPNAGTGKTVAVSGASLSGADATNYVLASTTGSGTGDISPRIVNLSGSGVYDGTTNAAAGIFTIGNLVGTETLTLSGSGQFADKNVGTGKAVSQGTLALGDGSGLASNYTLVGGISTADITPRTLTVTYDKVYDGGLIAAVTGDNRVAGDVLGFSGSAAFTDPNAGTGKTVNFSSMSLSGADAGNYALAANGATTANIATRIVSLSGSRVYDGTTDVAAGIFTLGNLAGSDTLTLTGSGRVADKNVGSGKAVTLGSLTLGNGSGLASNYTLVGGTDTADITPRTLTVSYDKTYDGNVAATVTGDDRIAGDVLGFGGSAAFTDAGIGKGKTVNIASLVVSGTDAGNYRVALGAGSATRADIAAPPSPVPTEISGNYLGALAGTAGGMTTNAGSSGLAGGASAGTTGGGAAGNGAFGSGLGGAASADASGNGASGGNTAGSAMGSDGTGNAASLGGGTGGMTVGDALGAAAESDANGRRGGGYRDVLGGTIGGTPSAKLAAASDSGSGSAVGGAGDAGGRGASGQTGGSGRSRAAGGTEKQRSAWMAGFDVRIVNGGIRLPTQMLSED